MLACMGEGTVWISLTPVDTGRWLDFWLSYCFATSLRTVDKEVDTSTIYWSLLHVKLESCSLYSVSYRHDTFLGNKVTLVHFEGKKSEKGEDCTLKNMACISPCISPCISLNFHFFTTSVGVYFDLIACAGDLSKLGKKMLEVEACDVPVVSESFLKDAAGGGALLKIPSATISDWGAPRHSLPAEDFSLGDKSFKSKG